MLQHLKGYQKSITFIKTGRLNKKNNTNINTSEKEERNRAEKCSSYYAKQSSALVMDRFDCLF